MKSFYFAPLFFSLVFAFPRPSLAQYVSENTPAVYRTGAPKSAAPGSLRWEKEQDRVYGHIGNSKLLKMKAINESLVSYFHDSCMSDTPYNPNWHGEYFSEKNGSWPLMKFGLEFNFYEQNASFRIMANDMGPLLGHLLVNNQQFLTMRLASDENDDCHYFESETNHLHQRIWLITDGDRLPYIPVSRKEYLISARTELNALRNAIVADLKQKAPIRSLSTQETDKKEVMDQLRSMYSGADLQVRLKMFLESYQSDEEYLRDNTAKGTAELDNTLHLMDSLLNHLSAEQLNKPAVVSAQAADFQGFEDGYGENMLIRMNPACFNSNPRADKPRFFLVSWQYDRLESKANEIDRLIKEKFDSRELSAILGLR